MPGSDLLGLIPILTVALVLGLRRGRLLDAAALGLAATAVIAWIRTGGGGPPWAVFGTAAIEGAWLALQAIVVVIAGLFFHEVSVDPRASRNATGPALPDPGASHRAIWFACFLVGPFVESATGFGVGVVAVVPLLVGQGLAGPPAIVLALFSQTLVPWGALAIGTVVGAGLAGLPLRDLGMASALLNPLVATAYLGFFWFQLRLAGRHLALASMIDDVAWTAGLCAAVVLANRWAAVEIAGLIAIGGVATLRHLRDSRPDRATLARTLRQTGPYVALTATLLVVRAVPGVSDFLHDAWILRPVGDLAPVSVLQNVALWAVVVAIGVGLARGLAVSDWRRRALRTVSSGWRAVVVTLLFIVMARLMSTAGLVDDLSHAIAGASPVVAVLASPVMAAAAGFLTGSNVASNAMLMPLQVGLARLIGSDLLTTAAVQNVIGSNFTLLSPIRVALGCAVLGLGAGPAAIALTGAVFRLLVPLGVALIGCGIAVSVLSWS